MLVREERGKDDRSVCSTVAYQLSIKDGLSSRRVIRPGEAGERTFFEHWLSSDGRMYAWLGPRLPVARHRAEVYNVASGKAVIPPVPVVSNTPGADPAGSMCSDGSSFWVEVEGGCHIYDLDGRKLLERLSHQPAVESPDSRWVVSIFRDERTGALKGIRLHRRGESQPWLEFTEDDMVGPAIGELAFSGDSRFLAWPGLKGVIIVVDLEALEREVGEFERTVLPK